jgi:protein-S-isoprenylcysteine O-methyltransferase Ste14
MKRTFAGTGRASAGAGTLDVDLGMLRPVPAPPATTGLPRSHDLGELTARVAIVVAFTFLAMRFAAQFAATGHITGLMLLASEATVVVLTVFRRATGIVDRSVRARILTTVACIGPLLLAPVIGGAVLPEAATATISGAGLLVVIAGKLSLGRSFGLMPANRGVVSTGLYRLVRHPIYMGYLVCHVGVLAANPSTWNVLTLVCADAALMIRALYEERVLAQDPAYRDYLQLVRWRVLPGIF